MRNKNKKRIYLTKKRKAKKMVHKYIAIIIFLFILPMSIIGHFEEKLLNEIDNFRTENVVITKQAIAQEFEIYEVKSEVIREVTMYNSAVEQCDLTPCISANGTNICEGAKAGKNYCASNAYPFGTILHIDKLGECEVVDRMNRRYANRVDWYAGMDIRRALQFGKQNLNIKEITKQ